MILVVIGVAIVTTESGLTVLSGGDEKRWRF